MSLGPPGGVLGSCVLVLLVLCLATVTYSAPSARRPGDDVPDGGADSWWGGAIGTAWNETKYWLLDAVEPTEYFPEDEDFIRISAPKAQQAPGPKEARSKRSATRDSVSEGLAADGRGPGSLSRHTRHLLDAGPEESPHSSSREGFRDSGPDQDMELLHKDLWALGEEGSGEGSGYGGL